MKGKCWFGFSNTHDVKIGEVQQNRFTGMPGFLTLAWGRLESRDPKPYSLNPKPNQRKRKTSRRVSDPGVVGERTA